MRVLVVGAGSMGTRRAVHAAAWGCDVDVLDEVDARAAKVGRAVMWATVDAARLPYDAAFVCTPPDAHVEVARRLVRADVGALFVEKPLAADLGLTETLVNEAADRPTMMGQTLRWHTDIANLAAYVSGGGLGEVLSVRAEFGHRLADWQHPDPVGTYRNGALLDAGTHEIDLATWMAGYDVRQLAGVAMRTGLHDMEAEDTADVLMVNGSGTIVNVHVDVVDPQYRRRLVVVGTENTAEWRWRPDPQMYQTETDTFLAVAQEIADGGDVSLPMDWPDLARGRRVLQLALAARMSGGRLLQV